MSGLRPKVSNEAPSQHTAGGEQSPPRNQSSRKRKAPGQDPQGNALLPVSESQIERIQDDLDEILQDLLAQSAGEPKEEMDAAGDRVSHGHRAAAIQATLRDFKSPIMDKLLRHCCITTHQHIEDFKESLLNLVAKMHQLQDVQDRNEYFRRTVPDLRRNAFQQSLERRRHAAVRPPPPPPIRPATAAQPKPPPGKGKGKASAAPPPTAPPDLLLEDGSEGDLQGRPRGELLREKLRGLELALQAIPEPLAALQRELPERVRTMRETVDAVSQALASAESETERLMRKAPPEAPRRSQRSQGGGSLEGLRGAARAQAREAERARTTRERREHLPQSQLASLLGRPA